MRAVLVVGGVRASSWRAHTVSVCHDAIVYGPGAVDRERHRDREPEHIPCTFLLVEQSGAYTESDAVIRMSWIFGGAWRIAALALAIPKAARDAVYRWVARNRYRWFGRREECFAPSAADCDRFLF